MRALADVMKLAQQAHRIAELEAENDALLKYASELVDKCTALKYEATEWKLQAAESCTNERLRNDPRVIHEPGGRGV